MRRRIVGWVLACLAVLLFLPAAMPSAKGVLEPAGRLVLKLPGDPNFGGLSALELDETGQNFIALSDRAIIYTGQLERKDGKLSGVTLNSGIYMIDRKGRVMAEHGGDTEGLARDPSGLTYFSGENRHVVGVLDIASGHVRPLPRGEWAETLQTNSGFEALALDPQGRPIAIPERSGELDRPFPVYRFENRRWTVPYTLRRYGSFLPVGADTGPDGRLYLLERHYVPLLGFATRIRSFAFGQDRLEDERLLLETWLGTHDNLEGISVWADPAGTIHLTLVSDDNYRDVQRTEIVEYLLKPSMTH